jgi:hypothetical protein
MTFHPRFQPHGESGGSSGTGSPDRQGQQRPPDDDVPDPFFKDPAKTVGEDVAKSLTGPKQPSGEHKVIRDAYTTEVPYEENNPTFDGSSYGAQMDRISRDKQRESDSRPKGLNAREIEAIYGARWKSDDSLTINEGLPRKSFSVWNIPGIRLLFKLAVLAAIVLGIFAIRLPIVDEDGVDTTSPLPIWAYQQMTMGSDQQMMQRLDGLERHFAITMLRIRKVSSASIRYELAFGIPPPTVQALVDEKILLPNRISDGWGNQFRIETNNETVMVRSAGKDRAFNTDDDITTLGDSPPNFSSRHYADEAQGMYGTY